MVYEMFCMTCLKVTILLAFTRIVNLPYFSFGHKWQILKKDNRWSGTAWEGPHKRGKAENDYSVSLHVLYEIVFLSGMFEISSYISYINPMYLFIR